MSPIQGHGSPPPPVCIGAAELYVYYRVRPGCEARAAQALCSMHVQLLTQEPNLHARWLRRCDTAPDGDVASSTPETWMEIYMCPDGESESAATSGITPALRDRIELLASAWADCLASPRQWELFEPCVW